MKTLLLISAALLFLNGCSQITIIEQSVLNLESQNDSLRAELSRLEKEYLIKQQDDFKAFKIAQELMLLRIEEKVVHLSGNVTESNARITEINTKTGILSDQLREKAVQDSLKQTQADAERRDLLDLGIQDFQLGNYIQSISTFASFLENYPEAPELSQAVYWNGEANLAMLRYPVAEEMFKRYIKEYATEEYFCTAIYKLGLNYQKQKDTVRRDALWGELKKRCPDSKESKLVGDKK